MPRLKPTRGTFIRASHPLARGLAGYWLLGEGTGRMIADLGPYRQHGVFDGGSPLWRPGRHGFCLQFDGTDECIDCGTGKFGWELTNEVSVVALVNQSASQVNTIFARSAYTRPVRLHSQSGGRFSWRVFTDTANDCIITSTSTHNTDGSEWVHVAGTWRPHEGCLYVNGVLEASDTNTDGDLNVTDDQFVGIGGTYEGNEYIACWNGYIEYVFIYNRALSAEDVRWLYREPFAMFEDSVNPVPTHASVCITSLNGSSNATSETSGRLESVNSSLKVKAIWLSDALLNGMTENALKLGTILSLGWFWLRLAGCSALYRGSDMDKIDFTMILAVSDQNATTLSPSVYLPHDKDTTYFYVIRRFNHCGDWEFTLKASVKVSIDENGDLAKPRPNKILASKIKPAGDNKVRLTWYYNSLEQQSSPACFKVYSDDGTEQIDFENVLDTIAYKGRKFYSYTSGPLQPGRYLFAIETENVDGARHGLPTQLAIELNDTNPNVISILDAETI